MATYLNRIGNVIVPNKLQILTGKLFGLICHFDKDINEHSSMDTLKSFLRGKHDEISRR